MAPRPSLFVGPSATHDRGVFTRRARRPDDVLEVCPVLVIPAEDRPLVDDTVFGGYYYEWGDDGEGALALGCGSMYNHTRHPNARYEMDVEARTITIVAVTDIAAGDEVTISYAGEPGADDSDLWFDPVEPSSDTAASGG